MSGIAEAFQTLELAKNELRLHHDGGVVVLVASQDEQNHSQIMAGNMTLDNFASGVAMLVKHCTTQLEKPENEAAPEILAAFQDAAKGFADAGIIVDIQVANDSRRAN